MVYYIRMKKQYYFLFVGLFMSVMTMAQDLRTTLGKAFTSQDSSDYYFKIAKRLIKTQADEGQYFFCKNARCTDYNQLDSAVVYGNRALKILQSGNDIPSLLTVYNNMAKVYRKQGQYDKAVAYCLQGIRIAEKEKKENWIAFFNAMLSLTYHDFESYPKGIYYGKKALKYWVSQKEKSPDMISNALNAVAINFDDWNKPDSALYYHKQVFQYYKGKDTLNVGETYNNIGNTLLKQKKFKEAKRWITSALKINDKNFELSQGNKDTDYYYERATNYTNLGQILGKEGNQQEAKIAFRKGLAFAQQSQSLEKIKDSYQALYEFNKSSGQPDSALVYMELLSGVEDSIFNLQSAKAISDAEAKYELSEKERNLTEERLRVQQSRFGLVTLAALLALGSVLGFHFYRQQKLKSIQKDQEMALQKALSKVEIQSQLHEQRLKISRDLHDNIGTQLTFVTLGMDRLKTSFAHQPTPILDQIDSLKSFTKTTIQELRDTVWAMNQSQMTFEDIQVRILRFTENLAWNEELSLEIEVDPELENLTLGSFQGISIYRILQESLNNALKHAQASVISAKVKRNPQGVQITIEDNGKGFDPTTASGNGLSHLKARVQELGGSISFHSGLGKGTRIELSIPLQS